MGLKEIEKNKEERKTEIDFRKILYALLILIFVLALYFLFSIKETKINEDEILKITNEEQAVKDFIEKNPGYKTRIVLLSKENLTSLSEKFPSLYANIPKQNFL